MRVRRPSSTRRVENASIEEKVDGLKSFHLHRMNICTITCQKLFFIKNKYHKYFKLYLDFNRVPSVVRSISQYSCILFPRFGLPKFQIINNFFFWANTLTVCIKNKLLINCHPTATAVGSV